MGNTDFGNIASRYERDSLIQKSAAEKLLGLLAIRSDDDVLDLGCGTGSLARKIRPLTGGRVTGIDPSEGMISEAKSNSAGLDIDFRVGTAESLEDGAAYSVIFCNSAFQWFRDPARALLNCLRALRPGGRMGIQAPAGKAYCPNFLSAIDAVARDVGTAATFAGFRSPWYFLDSAEEYAGLFRQAGFAVPFAKIETVTTRHSTDEVMTIFESGAAAGYLNADYYGTGLPGGYTAAFREIAARTFREQADAGGTVELTFNRIYLVAVREHAGRTGKGQGEKEMRT